MLRETHPATPRPEPAFDAAKLPVFMPDPSLWPRIVAARRRRQHARRWGLGGLAAAAVFGAALVLSWPRPADVTVSPLAAGQGESQRLEREWRRLSADRGIPTGRTTRLRVIDATLQSAYDRDASAAELTELWQLRTAALRQLISGLRDEGGDASPMRI